MGGIETVLASYAKEGVFLALFLYLLFLTIKTQKELRDELKNDIKEMQEKHTEEIDRMGSKHDEEMRKLEIKSEKRENELVRLLSLFGDKYDILTHKVDEVLKKLRD